MPQLAFTPGPAGAAVAAGATWAPLAGWTYEFLPWPAHVRILMNATAVGLVAAVYSGSESIVDESPITAGGTAGVIPAELNVPPLDFQAAAGDKLRIAIRNPTAGAQSVNGLIIVQPLG